MLSNQTQSALLFIPDISGFTQFVNETEIIHSQHIIKELLEILIESNQIDLQVGEIEGDAIFFYKFCEKPGLKILLEQVEKMFTRFHQHLKLYDHRRICPCGACKTAVDLKLKVVAHFGAVTSIAVKEHKKLFGRDVILVHRLLKNNLDKKEYFLFTDSLSENAKQSNQSPDWYHPQQGSQEYDVGKVPFSFSDLSPLHETISDPAFPVKNLSSKTDISFSEEEVIGITMENLFSIMIEQLQRGNWNKRKKENGNPEDEDIYRIGAQHTCLMTNDSTNITESVKIETDKIVLIEMGKNGIAGYRYVLKKLSSATTLLLIEMLVTKNPIMKLGFTVVYRSRMRKNVHRFFENLKAYLNTNNMIPA